MPICAIGRTAIYPQSIRARSVRRALAGMHTLLWSAVVAVPADPDFARHPIGDAILVRGGHAVVRAIEAHFLNAIVAFDARGFLDARSHVFGHFTEDGDFTLEDLFRRASLHVAGDVVHETLLGALVPDSFPQGTRSIEVLGANLAEEGDSSASEFTMDLVQVGAPVLEGNRLNRAQVVRARTLVVKGHVPITLEIGNTVSAAGAVNRELLVVDANTMAVSVRVGEEARLEDGIGGRLNAGDHVGRVEGCLFDLGEVVPCILVELEDTNLTKRELLLWPDVGQVKDVDLLLLPQLLGFFGRHGLPRNGPRRVFLALNGVEQVFLGEVWRIICGFFLSDELGALIGLHVHLCVDPIARLVDKLHGVPAVAVHEAVALGNPAVAHQNHDLVDRLRVLGEVIPEHGGIIGTAQVGGWVSLLGVDEVRELGWIAQEEDGSVVGHHVPIAFFCAELDAEASRITSQIVGTGLATDG